MDIKDVQDLVAKNFGALTESKTAEYGAAAYLIQGGQLADALLRKGGGRDVSKEIVDNLIVLVAIANKLNLDINTLLNEQLLNRDAKQYMAKMND